MFSRRPGSSLYTLTTASAQVAEAGQVAASSQVSASGHLAASCSCRVLSHQTLLWHHRLGHPSLPRLRGMHSRLLVAGLPRSLPSLPRSPAPPCLPCVEGRQHAAPHSSEFPPTTAPLQTLHMDVWGPAPVGGTDQECYFLMVVDDYTRYTTVFPLRRKVDVSKTSPTLRWTGKVGDAKASKLSSRTLRCVFLGFPTDAPPWQFYHPRSHRVFSSQDVTFDDSVCYYRLHPHASHPPVYPSSHPQLPLLRAFSPPCFLSSVPPLLRASSPPCLLSSVPSLLRAFSPPCLLSSMPSLLRAFSPPCLLSSVPPLLRASSPPCLLSSEDPPCCSQSCSSHSSSSQSCSPLLLPILFPRPPNPAHPCSPLLSPQSHSSQSACSSQSPSPPPPTPRLSPAAAVLAECQGQWQAQLRGWSKGGDCAQVEGVRCNSAGFIVSLNVSAKHLEGTIPDAIGNLTTLTQLRFSSTKLIGSLPPTVPRLTRLVEL
ncbi:unnamed protein product [Closterium sp. NIES-53]